MTLDIRNVTPHSATDLRYRLVVGPVELAPLHVLCCRAITVHGWSIEFVILGASHAVMFEKQNRTLTEMLTCIAPTVDVNVQAAFEIPVPTSSETYSLPNGLGVDKSWLNLGLFPLHRGDEFEGVYDGSCLLDLEFPFPGQKAPGVDLPRTRIGWRVTEDGLEVETTHTYPEAAVGVRSRTNFKLASTGFPAAQR